jgi:hypothetical protein
MAKQPLAPLDFNQRYTINETGAYLRQSRAKTYADFKAGKLAFIQDGRRRYVPGAAIAARSSLDAAA